MNIIKFFYKKILSNKIKKIEKKIDYHQQQKQKLEEERNKYTDVKNKTILSSKIQIENDLCGAYEVFKRAYERKLKIL